MAISSLRCLPSLFGVYTSFIREWPALALRPGLTGQHVALADWKIRANFARIISSSARPDWEVVGYVFCDADLIGLCQLLG